MTAFSTPCTVLTAIAGMVGVDDFDSLESSRKFIREFYSEEEVQAEPYNGEDDDYLVRPWLVNGWASRAEWLYAG